MKKLKHGSSPLSDIHSHSNFALPGTRYQFHSCIACPAYKQTLMRHRDHERRSESVVRDQDVNLLRLLITNIHTGLDTVLTSARQLLAWRAASSCVAMVEVHVQTPACRHTRLVRRDARPPLRYQPWRPILYTLS